MGRLNKTIQTIICITKEPNEIGLTLLKNNLQSMVNRYPASKIEIIQLDKDIEKFGLYENFKVKDQEIQILINLIRAYAKKNTKG